MGLTKEEDIWSCTECGELQGRHDLYFERDDNEFCERCYAEYEEQEENLNKFKEYLAKTMADIDVQNFPEKTFQEHYDTLIKWGEFDLLKYWLVYNGVFDGGEDMLNYLKILVDGYPGEKKLAEADCNSKKH
jgi:hypothetical protein